MSQNAEDKQGIISEPFLERQPLEVSEPKSPSKPKASSEPYL